MYTISDIAEKVEISAHTLRYYEKEGIIEPDRSESGVRQYDDQHVKWMRFVKKLRETKMPIVKIKQYAQLYKEGAHTTALRLKLLEEHHHSIQKQVETLIETEKLLDKKITVYKEYIAQESP